MSESSEPEGFQHQKSRCPTSSKSKLKKQNKNEQVNDDEKIMMKKYQDTESKTENIHSNKKSLAKLAMEQSSEDNLLFEENIESRGFANFKQQMKQTSQQREDPNFLISKNQKSIKRKATPSKHIPKLVKKYEEIKKIEVNEQEKIIKDFDEKPIGKSQFNFSQFPEGTQPIKVETNYTLQQKLKSKAVKLRIQGLEELLHLLSTNPDFPQCQELSISKFLKETNPACLEKALLCFQKWIQIEKKWGQEEIKSIIENGYINGKHASKKLASEILDMLYEKNPESVQVSIIVGLKGKTPKNLAGYISIISELLAIYGIKKMKFLKPYLSDIVTILNRQKLVAVKAEGTNLLREAYKWLSKDIVEQLTKDLKEGFKKELDIFWEGYDKTQIMSAPKEVETLEKTLGKKMDVYELSEAVDIFKKYNVKWADNVLDQDKWNDKVEYLKDFVKNANVPKIANTDFRHITEMIKRLINDTNMNVVLWDLKALSVLTKGLRRPLAGFVKTIFPAVIAKFRDKKTSMIEETFNTLNSLIYCISIEDVNEEISNSLQDKNPNMKINLMNWIGKFVQKKVQENEELTKKARECLESLLPLFDKLLSDGALQVRECTMINIEKMKMLLGDKFFFRVGIKRKVDDTPSKSPRKLSTDRQVRSSTPLRRRKVSVQKQERPISSRKEKVQEIKTKAEINEQFQIFYRDLNHSDWEKRKGGAEALIRMFEESEEIKIPPLDLIDLIKTLRSRISDPNKRIIKYFVRLSGIVFHLLPQKQYKTNIKSFILSLIEGLSDKTEANRKQICSTLQRLSFRFGKQNLLSLLGHYLDTDKDLRFEVANIILQNIDYLAHSDLKNYPKGILRLLMDKFKRGRSIGEKLFQATHDQIGMDTFRTLAKAQPPAIENDLNEFFKKYDFRSESISQISKSVISSQAKPPRSVKKSAQRTPSKEEQRRSKQKVPSKASNPTSVATTNRLKSVHVSEKNCHSSQIFQGGHNFANLKTLKKNRIARAQKNQEYPWEAYRITKIQERELVQWLTKSLKGDLTFNMLSYDYRKNIEATEELIHLCRDQTNHPEIKQIYDILIQWVIVRLWGGNPSLLPIFELLPVILQILERKKQQLLENQINLILRVLREYVISACLITTNPSSSILKVIKCMTFLTSPSKLLKKVLSEFSVELNNLHKHLPDTFTEYYRVILCEIVKKSLIQYVGQDDCLYQASKIKELKKDKEFVDNLFGIINENILRDLGFVRKNSLKDGEQSLKSQRRIKKSYSSESFGDSCLVSKDDGDNFDEKSQERECKSRKMSTQAEEDQELQPILSLLHKKKTFDKGLKELSQYISLHENFRLMEYLTSQEYSQKFILKVIKGLEGKKEEPNFLFGKKDEENFQSSIHGKIKMLKMRFEEIKPHREKEQQNTSEQDSRTKEIQKKISEIKHKMSPLVNH